MSSRLIYSILALLLVILIIRLVIFGLSIKPYPTGKKISFLTQVLSQPKISNRGQSLNLTMPNSQRAVVTFRVNPLISYGDDIKVEGEIGYFQTKNGDKIALINNASFIVVKKADSVFYRLRENIIKFFNSNLSPSQSALSLGIVFGIKQEMPKDFYTNLQKTGLMHVVAASGMNITMVGGFLFSLLASFMKRQFALFISILGILFYAFMAGFEPSIVRASIMGILVFGSQIIGRQSSSFLGLFFAAFVMLFINPSLIFDIGFQLSFLATFGLIYLSPVFYIKPKVKKIIKNSFVGEDLVTTLTAQIFTLPILLANFGAYSILSIFVNAIILWTIPIIMIFGGLATVLSLILEPLGVLFLFLSLPFLIYFESIVSFFGRLGSQIQSNNLPIELIVGYYLVLVSLIMPLRKKI